MKASARIFQILGIMSNRQQRIQPSDVSKFSCIWNSLSSANPKGTQNLLGAMTQSYKNDRLKSPIRTGSTCSRDSRVQTSQRWNNRRAFIIKIINNSSR